MSDEQTSYKVTDRRLFNPDGTPREVPEDEKPEPKPEAIPSVEPAPPETASAGSASEPTSAAATATSPAEVEAMPLQQEQQPNEAAQPASAEAGAEESEAELPGADDPASFASFLMSIASNAASSLGMMEHPVTRKREVDLELGKHWIDVLGMLQEKTRGNLLPQEQQILEGLLSDLRMQYVSLTNAAPKARTYSSRDITGG